MDIMGLTDSRDTSSDEITTNAQLERLEEARFHNDDRLKSRFEHIFAKYGRDFTAVGDEIDMRTGEIVVNNGHLERMQNEVDPGTSASSTFLRTFQENLEDESHASSSEDESNLASDYDESDADEIGLDDPSSGFEDGQPRLKIENSDDDNPPPVGPFSTMGRPAPRLAHLLMGQSVRHPIDLTQAMDGSASHDADDFKAASLNNSMHTNMLEKIPGVEQAINEMSSNSHVAGGVDTNTIQALGATIANQLASLLSINKPNKTKKRRWRRGADPIWDYPELPTTADRPKKRTKLSDAATTVGKSPNAHLSLWAPSRSPSRSRRVKAVAYRPPSPDDDDVPDPQDMDESSTCPECGLSEFSDRDPGQAEAFCNTCHLSCPRPKDREESVRSISAESFDDNDLSKGDDASDHDNGKAYTANTSRRMESEPSIPYTLEEDALIIRLREHDRLSWLEIAPHLKGRTWGGITFRYRNNLRNRNSEARRLVDAYVRNSASRLGSDQDFAPNVAWDKEMDQKLFELRECLKLDWAAIAANFPSETAETVFYRYRAMVKAGRWERRRAKMPQNMKHRDSENSIPPTSGPTSGNSTRSDKVWRFTEQEDEMIVHMKEVRGMKWSQIATHLPGRTVESVSSRYKKFLGPSSTIKNRSEHDSILTDDSEANLADGMQTATPPPSSTRQDDALQLAPTTSNIHGQSISNQSESLGHGRKKVEGHLLRRAVGNNLRLQSDSLQYIEQAQTETFNRRKSDGQFDEDDDRASSSVRPSVAAPRTATMSRYRNSSPRSSSPSSDYPEQVFSLQKYQRLLKFVVKFALEQGKSSWIVQVKQIYSRDPHNSGLQKLLDIISTDGDEMSQRLRLFENTLTACLRQQEAESTKSTKILGSPWEPSKISMTQRSRVHDRDSQSELVGKAKQPQAGTPTVEGKDRGSIIDDSEEAEELSFEHRRDSEVRRLREQFQIAPKTAVKDNVDRANSAHAAVKPHSSSQTHTESMRPPAVIPAIRQSSIIHASAPCTPAPVSKTPSLGSSSKKSKLRYDNVSPWRVSTPTRVIVHRNGSGVRTPHQHSGTTARIVQTPARAFCTDTSADELS